MTALGKEGLKPIKAVNPYKHGETIVFIKNKVDNINKNIGG